MGTCRTDAEETAGLGRLTAPAAKVAGLRRSPRRAAGTAAGGTGNRLFDFDLDLFSKRGVQKGNPQIVPQVCARPDA